jgi:hypothetical protein
MDALGRAMFPQGGSYFGHRVRLHAPPYSRGFMYRTYPIRPVRLRGVWASLVAPHPSGCPGAGGRKSHRLWRGRCRRLGRWHPDLRGTAPHRQKPTSCVSGRSRVGVWETNSRTRLRHRLPLSLIHTAYSSSHCCSPSVLSFHIQMALVESSQSHPSPRRTPGKRGTPRSGCEVRQPSRHPRRIVPPLGCGGRNTHSIKTRPRSRPLRGTPRPPNARLAHDLSCDHVCVLRIIGAGIHIMAEPNRCTSNRAGFLPAACVDGVACEHQWGFVFKGRAWGVCVCLDEGGR